MGLFTRGGDEKKGTKVKESGGDAALGIVVGYVKQEVLEPLRGLGRFVAYGLAGSLLLCVACFLALLGLLRLFQDETGSTFSGDLDWIPYFIVAFLGLAAMALAGWRIVRGPALRRLPKAESTPHHVEPAAPATLASPTHPEIADNPNTPSGD